MDDFNRKRHAVYKLTYHAVFVIKYRRNVMSEPIIDQMRQYAAHLIGQHTVSSDRAVLSG